MSWSPTTRRIGKRPASLLAALVELVTGEGRRRVSDTDTVDIAEPHLRNSVEVHEFHVGLPTRW